MSSTEQIHQLAEAAFDTGDANPLRETQALVVAHHGEIVYERYGPGFDQTSTFISWSMAKSVLSALIGVLIGEGRLSLTTPIAAREWPDGDPRREIIVEHLLQMRSGLRWAEDYVDAEVSDVIEMLFGTGQHDVAAHAASMPLEFEPGDNFRYSSGTSNILSRAASQAIGGGPGEFESKLVDGLLRPAGMENVTLKFDDAGTWIGSSFLYATARDYLAFGELFRNDGVAYGRRLLPEGWVEQSIAEQAVDTETGQGYGLHWWLVRDEPRSFAASGYEGQRIQVTPEHGLTFVRLGKTPDDYGVALRQFYKSLVDSFAE